MTTVGIAAVLMLTLAQTIPPTTGLPDLSTHKEIKTEVEINASAGTVWGTLTNFQAYIIWNPWIYPASGEAVAGRQLDLTLHGGTVIRFNPTVLVAQPERELSWTGKISIAGVERVATFEIQPLGPHSVHFVAMERFKGILLPLAGGVTGDSATGIHEMAEALRDRAELLEFSPPPRPYHISGPTSRPRPVWPPNS
jgi:hypothetical protein